MRCLILASVFAFALGCGGAPVEKPIAAPAPTPPAVKPPVAASPPPVEPPPVTADSFPNSEEAVQALVQAVTESQSQEFSRAQSWLVLQQASAIPAVTELIQDESAPMFARTAACKILAQLGPGAVQPLLDASSNGNPRMREVATEQLGNVRPTSPQVISTLIDLAQGADTDIRLSAILGLEHIDPPATDAAEAMLAILNNADEPEPLRSAAKECLTKVNPRKTFND